MADKSYISKIQLPSGTEPYWLKDLEARTMINALSSIVSGSLVVCGETTTSLADGSTVNPVKVKYNVTIRGVDYSAGSDYTAVAGDTFFYNSKEFVFDGTNWIEFGDITGLGNLAFADQASASYTPSGTVSAAFSGNELTSTGSFTPSGTVSAAFSGTELTSTGSFTPSGTVSAAFSGNELTSTGSFTPSGEISAKFSGTELTSTGDYTPSGTVSTPVISLTSGGGTTTVKNLSVESVVQSATQGTLPSLGMTVGGDEGETLSISWGAGTLPTFTPTYTQNITAVSSVPSYSSSQPTFTGTSATIDVTGTPQGSITDAAFKGSSGSVSVTGTPSGSITGAEFKGTSGNVSVTGTPSGSITDAAFEGTAGSVSVTGTPSGSITGAEFKGTTQTITSNPVPNS